MRVAHEANRRHRLRVPRKRAATVSEVKSPQLDRLVGGTRRHDGGVAGHVDCQGGKLVAVEREVKLERVRKKHLHGPVEQRHADVLAVGRGHGCQRVVREPQHALGRQAQRGDTTSRAGPVRQAKRLERPRPDRLVRPGGEHPQPARLHGDGPHTFAFVRLNVLHQRGCAEVVELELTCLGAHEQVRGGREQRAAQPVTAG
mmetsp:Transcript_4440/g.11353  ORF Transcript_4440/g.11353 Transcript_4440/m.11353 type:complete len:201 (-) Transcript_4440:1486-2088(-)